MASSSLCLILASISYKLVVRLEASLESGFFWGIYSSCSISRHTGLCPHFASAKPNGFSSSWLCFKFNWMEEGDKKAHLVMLESWWNLDSWIGIWFSRENREGVGNHAHTGKTLRGSARIPHGRRSGELEDIVRSDQGPDSKGFYMPWGISDVLNQSRQIRPDFRYNFGCSGGSHADGDLQVMRLQAGKIWAINEQKQVKIPGRKGALGKCLKLRDFVGWC